MKLKPTHIYYMNTIQCNQRCTKCSHWKHKDGAPRLPVDKFIKALKNIKTAEELCIVGGEPLIFKDNISQILEGISQTIIRTTIITNGVLMDKAFLQTVSKYNMHLVISIDTMNRKFWEFVRGVNSYDVVFKNLEYAFSQLSPAQISIQSVLSKETQPHIEGVREYADSKGVFHSVQDYVSDGFGGSWTALYAKEDGRARDEVCCFAVGRNLSILPSGDVLTCFQQNLIVNCERPLGNLNSQDIEEILSSNYVTQVCEQMRECILPCRVLKCNTKN
jgi:MoaA/NifB/PqqE/SkfB family radical SAM enzyme